MIVGAEVLLSTHIILVPRVLLLHLHLFFRDIFQHPIFKEMLPLLTIEVFLFMGILALLCTEFAAIVDVVHTRDRFEVVQLH